VPFDSLDPGYRVGKKTGSRSGMNNPDHISESLEKSFLGYKILKFFDADQGWKKFGSGINIPDPQHWKDLYSALPVLNMPPFRDTEVEVARIFVECMHYHSEAITTQ
jgi:hypothetical protein